MVKWHGCLRWSIHANQPTNQNPQQHKIHNINTKISITNNHPRHLSHRIANNATRVTINVNQSSKHNPHATDRRCPTPERELENERAPRRTQRSAGSASPSYGFRFTKTTTGCANSSGFRPATSLPASPSDGSSWTAPQMRNLVNKVTAQLNADPKRKKVIPTTAIDALVHRLCLDNVRNLKVAQERKSKGDLQYEGVIDSFNDEEEDHGSTKEDTPPAPEDPRFGDAEQSSKQSEMETEDDQQDGKLSVNTSNTDIAQEVGKEMRKLVKKVTAQLNADPKIKKVIPTAEVGALVHRLCLDNARNLKVAQERKSKGDSQDEEEDRNPKDEEDDHRSSDEGALAVPTEPPDAQQQAVETDMDNEDGQDDKEFRHFGGGKWSVNESHTEIDEQLSNEVTDMPNGDLNGQTRLAEHDHEIRFASCRPVGAKCDDENRSIDNGRQSRSCELNPAPIPLSPVKIPLPQVRADNNDDTRSMDTGRETRPCELNPAPIPLSPVKIPLPQVRAENNDDACNMDNGRESRLCELNPAPIPLSPVNIPLPPVRAENSDDARSMDNGRESRPCELNPAPKPLSPAATVPEDTVHISLPQASQCDTRTSILVHFGNQSPSNPPVVIPRAKPFHQLYLSVTGRVPCNFDHVLLGAIVPETTEMVYLDTEEAWVRLAARREVVRLVLVLMPHTEDISLPQGSQFDTRTSVLVHFGNESPSNPPVVIPRAKPLYKLYLSVSKRARCNDDQCRLGAIVPETTEMVYLDTEQAWVRLAARKEVVRLILLLMRHTGD
ncbi:hypothetical protein FN846DRAFT_887105 [Sphaerosporella brunnea]|uniref:Uncharacterized protein n=1 Tax=Sphaerosporella brunnea TaxID=1250544 RepID=A0A5J5F7Y4_9PEZI|nr:hypothetical protein FN846DRAFT_887105 [Sphaerosporella brunnea]